MLLFICYLQKFILNNYEFAGAQNKMIMNMFILFTRSLEPWIRIYLIFSSSFDIMNKVGNQLKDARQPHMLLSQFVFANCKSPEYFASHAPIFFQYQAFTLIWIICSGIKNLELYKESYSWIILYFWKDWNDKLFSEITRNPLNLIRMLKVNVMLGLM